MDTSHLSHDQRAVLIGKATEPPYSGQLLYNLKAGRYQCALCQADLFDSSAKFDSGCGWPSFDQAVDNAVEYLPDDSHGMIRTEIVCKRCRGHLGHVFDDGPKQTTHKRYCVNSLALDFKAID